MSTSAVLPPRNIKKENEAEWDLESCEPRRWLVMDGTGKTSFNANAIPSLAFGGGYRGCLGECLSMTLLVSSLGGAMP